MDTRIEYTYILAYCKNVHRLKPVVVVSIRYPFGGSYFEKLSAIEKSVHMCVRTRACVRARVCVCVHMCLAHICMVKYVCVYYQACVFYA